MRVISRSSKPRVLVSSGCSPQHRQWAVPRLFFQKRQAQTLGKKASVGVLLWAVRASAGTRGWMQWNAASDNTGESREGVGGGSIERGAASGRPNCSRRARGGLMVLKEGIDGGGSSVACVRVWCVCVSALCVSLSASRSLPSWLALARNGAGRRLTDGNNVQYY